MPENPLIAHPVALPAPAGETLPAPTPEQERAADQLFSRPEQHNAALDVLGMVASVQFLHDLAGEMFRRNHHEEEQPEPEEIPETPAESDL